MLRAYVSRSGNGAALTPGSPLALDDSLLVFVGASNIEGNAGDTPVDYVLDYLPFSTNGATVNNQGHGGHGFDYGDNPLTDATDIAAVQALRGTATGPEILIIAGDPIVNELLGSDGARSPADLLTSWATLVDYYRANGWSPAEGRRLVIVNCLTVDEDWTGGGSDVSDWNTLVASAWQTRADAHVDVSSITAAMPDGIHMTAQNANDMAALIVTALVGLD